MSSVRPFSSVSVRSPRARDIVFPMPVVFKFGDNVDTDGIISAKWAGLSEPAEFASHCFENIRPDFGKSVRPGDVVLGGENFGCGSSRERAPYSIKACGVSAVVAKSFARIFFRNSINIGLPLIECPEAFDHLKDGDPVRVDTEKSVVICERTGRSFQGKPFPPFIAEIVRSGGIVPYYKTVRKRHE